MDHAARPGTAQRTAPKGWETGHSLVTLPSGARVPTLGQGTWNMGDDAARRQEELAAIRLGVDLGMTLIDTAEMYGQGKSESLVGEAIDGIRDDVFLVSTVLPSNAGRRAAIAAVRAEPAQLRTDRIDLYLLHWRGGTGLHETVDAFEDFEAGRQDRCLGRQQLRYGRHAGARWPGSRERLPLQIRSCSILRVAASNMTC